MTFLLILLIIIALFLYGMKEYFQIKWGVRPQHTPEATIAYLSQLLERSAETGTVLNLASGNGGVVLQLAKRLPTWEVTGVERNPTSWIISNIRSIGKNFGNYRFFLQDPLQFALKDYNVVFLNQEQKVLKQWEATLARRLPPGGLFITYNAVLPRIRPLETITVSPTAKLYIYKKPALSDSEQPVTLPVEPVGIAPVAPVPVPEKPEQENADSNPAQDFPTEQPL